MKHRLYYLSPRDMRKNRADPVSIMKSCREFERNGFNVTLVTPRFRRKDNVKNKVDIWGLYGMKPSFRIVELWTFLSDSSGYLTVNIQRLVSYTIYFLYLYFTFRLNRNDVIYSKCYNAVVPALVLRKVRLLNCKVLFDVAVFEDKRFHRFVARNVDGSVMFNATIHKHYVSDFGVRNDSIFRPSFPSQFADYSRVVENIDKRHVRTQLGLPSTRPVVLYSGKMGPAMKELHWILDAARHLPHYTFAFVGLQDKFRKQFEGFCDERGLKNVMFFGFQHLETLYTFVHVSDVLISYYDSEDSWSANQRVPAKLTVYICSGVPIVIADLPTHREWFGDDQVTYAIPNCPESLANTIANVLENSEPVLKIAYRLKEYAASNTYEAAFRGISDFIRRCNTRPRKTS